MAEKKTKPKKAKNIKVVEGDSPLTKIIKDEPGSYNLHIGAVETPKQKPRKAASNREIKRKQKAKRKTGIFWVKVWNTLEWIVTSALIFMIIFFALNFSSYSELFFSKLDKLRGDFKLHPYIEEVLSSGEEDGPQELLPVEQVAKEQKTEVPALEIEVAPPDERIIIPRINKSVPVVNISTENLIKRDWNALESEIQEALQSGVVHYPGTARAGQHGNVVITGHSSYFPWDPGRFKDVFALLHEVVVGDDIIVYNEQEKFLYRVYETKVVQPDEVSILTQSGEDRLTLITCTPVGTNLRRLIVLARPVD